MARLTLSPPKRQLIAHRGVSGRCPENTLVSMQMAHSLGFNWIECDVQITADDELVIFHDESLSRTSNGGRQVLHQCTLDILRQYDYGSWCHEAFHATPLLTLTALWEYANTTGLNLNLELKPYHNANRLATQFNQFLTANPRKFDILVSSFDHAVLHQIRQVHATVPLGFLVESHDESVLQQAIHLPDCAYHLSAKSNSPEMLKQILSEPVEILLYTVNDIDFANTLRHWGAWGIFTDTLLP